MPCPRLRPRLAPGSWTVSQSPLDRTATLALIASTEDAFMMAVADPFVNGHASAFHAFSDFFQVLGLRVKDSKEQPPERRHVLQRDDVRSDGVALSPRVAKLRHAIARALDDNSLAPRDADLPASCPSSHRRSLDRWDAPPCSPSTPGRTTPPRATTTASLLG